MALAITPTDSIFSTVATTTGSSVSDETYPTPGISLVFGSIKSETSVKLSIPRAALIAEFATSATKGSPP